MAAKHANQPSTDENGFVKQEDAFNQLLFGPSPAGKRRRSSFALPIEESTGRPTLPTISKLTKPDANRGIHEDKELDKTEKGSLQLIANSFRTFRTEERPKRVTSEQLEEENNKNQSNENVAMVQSTDTEAIPNENGAPAIIAIKSPRVSLKPEEFSVLVKSPRSSLKPDESSPSVRSPRISLTPDDSFSPTRKTSLARNASKLEEKVSFLKNLTQRSKLEDTPSFVQSSSTPRHSLPKRNSDGARRESMVEYNQAMLPTIFIEPIPVVQQVDTPTDNQNFEAVVPSEEPKKRFIPLSPDLKRVTIDPQVLEGTKEDLEWEEEHIEQTHKKGTFIFDKAPTGRLNQKKITRKPKKGSDVDNVLLIGKKVEQRIVVEPSQTKIKPSNPVEILEPFHLKANLKNGKVAKESDPPPVSTVPSVPIEEECQHEADVGLYQNVSEVDAVWSHFAQILEDRKQKLLSGVSDVDIITDTEVPILLNNIRTASPEPQAVPVVPIEDSLSIQQIESRKPPMMVHRQESIHQNGQDNAVVINERPKTAGEASVRTHSTRSIKSASAVSRSLTSRSSMSNCTCTCSTMSCSWCKSRSASAQDTTSRVSSAKASSIKSNPNPLNFSRYATEDPLGTISLLDFTARPEPTDQILVSMTVENESSVDSEASSEVDNLSSKKKMAVSGSHIPIPPTNSQMKLDESLKSLPGYDSLATPKMAIPKSRKSSKELRMEKANKHRKSISDIIINRVAQSQQVKRAQLVAPKTDGWFENESVPKSRESARLSLSLAPIREDEVEPSLQRMDSLDLQVRALVQQYELKKIQDEENNRPKSRRQSSILLEEQRMRELAEQTEMTDDSQYTTEEEEEIKLAKPLPSKGKRFWQVIKKDIQKKHLINTLMGSVELEANIAPGPEPEAPKEVENDLDASADLVDVNPLGLLKDGRVDPKGYYQMQRRQYDMEKYPAQYFNKRFNPETNQLELSVTKRPTIGLSPEQDKTKQPPEDDPEVVYRFHIRHGLQINGFTSAGQKNLYEVVHNIDRRAGGLSGMDRVKYPTYDDPGPPLDATGTPILDESMAGMAKEPDLKGEVEKLDILINDSNGPVPAYFRRRGILLARLEKFNRAMEDFDAAIQYDPFHSDGLWHRHQLYLRYNDAFSALADLDSLTENNKVHLAAFQAKARIYQALGMYKYAIVNYATVIRLKPDNPDAYFNRALLFEIEDEVTFANEDFRAVRLLDPTNEVAIHNLAMYSFQKQLWSDCIGEFSKLIMFNPENADYFMYRGRSYASMSFFVEALEDLTQAIRLNPDKSVYFFHRGCLLREQNFSKAIQDLSVSLLLDDSVQNSDAYYFRGCFVLYSPIVPEDQSA
jgi:tetratricopeptide (TPR) repeat protein